MLDKILIRSVIAVALIFMTVLIVGISWIVFCDDPVEEVHRIQCPSCGEEFQLEID